MSKKKLTKSCWTSSVWNSIGTFVKSDIFFLLFSESIVEFDPRVKEGSKIYNTLPRSWRTQNLQTNCKEVADLGEYLRPRRVNNSSLMLLYSQIFVVISENLNFTYILLSELI